MFCELAAVRPACRRLTGRPEPYCRPRYCQSGTRFARFLAAERAVALAPAADHVEVLQREAGRVHAADGTPRSLRAAVLLELLADGRGPADVRLDRPGTFGGGGLGGRPTMFRSTHAPRTTGEVLVPLAVTFSTLACVSTPPR